MTRCPHPRDQIRAHIGHTPCPARVAALGYVVSGVMGGEGNAVGWKPGGAAPGEIRHQAASSTLSVHPTWEQSTNCLRYSNLITASPVPFLVVAAASASAGFGLATQRDVLKREFPSAH